jgi:hypothetical protein
MWLTQNKNKRYQNGQLSFWAEKAREGYDIEWEITDGSRFGYTGRVRLDGQIMTKEEARSILLNPFNVVLSS